MQCSDKLLEAFHNHELAQERVLVVSHHLDNCSDCAEKIKILQGIKAVLETYQNIEIEDRFLTELAQIPYQTPKRWTLFHLLPKQFALTACLVVFALFSGVLVNTLTMDTESRIYTQFEELFDEVSLVSLLGY